MSLTFPSWHKLDEIAPFIVPTPCLSMRHIVTRFDEEWLTDIRKALHQGCNGSFS